MLNWKHCLVSSVFLVSPLLNANPLEACYPEWQGKARSLGLSNQIVDVVIPSLQNLDNVLELDRKQPEFTDSFANYFNRRVTEQRISKGRELMQEYSELLARLTKEYGVPAQYLISFWGLETNFGSFKGNTSTLNALATLACDARRKDFFTAQLFDAFYLVQDYKVEPSTMLGSWAGAVGHTQFMPGNYRKFAVDGDSDGRIDLWNSIPDALTSAANFLKNIGWQAEERWGREVLLPKDFTYNVLVDSPKKTLAEWRALGLVTAQGDVLAEENLQATLLLPAGHTGPAFLSYQNFDVIMGWNRSKFYALAVGHLADRINGAGRLTIEPPEQPRLMMSEVQVLQEKLIELGLLKSNADGIMGPATKEAIRLFQQQKGMIPDGFPEAEVFQALNIVVGSTEPAKK